MFHSPSLILTVLTSVPSSLLTFTRATAYVFSPSARHNPPRNTKGETTLNTTRRPEAERKFSRGSNRNPIPSRTSSATPTRSTAGRGAGLRGRQAFLTHVGDKDLGQYDGPVLLLVDLEEGDQGPAYSECRAVEGVQKLGPSAFSAVADGEPAGLVVGGVRRACHLAEIAAARHPGFQVVLAVGGAAEIAGTDVDHAVG